MRLTSVFLHAKTANNIFFLGAMLAAAVYL